MNNPIAEVLDTFFNGRPAPKSPQQTIRVRITPQQIEHLFCGGTLLFKANGTHILVSAKESN